MRERLATGAVLLAAAVAWGWALGSRTMQPYYAAAVHSMAHNASAFFFAGYDGAGVVSIDKPPLAFWTQTLAVWLFGFHPWAIALVQTIEGVAAVFVLNRVVRRWAGPGPALLAAAFFALTPVTAAITRDNLPDTLLVLFLLLGAYGVTRAIESDGVGWLLAAGAFAGLGFLTKMLAAWIVLPAFAAAYFVGGRGPRLRRIGLAGLVTVAVSLSWPLVVSLWPGAKPYVGSTTDGSVWQLAFGYNGLTRLFGGGTGLGGAAVGSALGGAPGPLRLVDAEIGGQIAWLLPLALGALVVAAFRARGASPSVRAGWVLWGGWLVVGGLVFSFTGGIFHAYYTAELAPAIAALAANGLVTAWRWQRGLLPVAVAGTALFAYVLLARTPDWLPWLRYTVLALAALAVVAALLHAPRTAFGIGLAAVVAGPAAFVVDVAVRPVSVLEAGDPHAGPATTPAVASVRALAGHGAEAAFVRFVDQAYRFGPAQAQVLTYAQAHASAARVVLAVEGGTYGADPFVVNTDARVAPLGGYLGFDPAPDAAGLQRLVGDGSVRFVLLPRVYTEAGHSGGTGPGADAGVLIRRIQWTARHCVPVPPARIGPDAAGAGVLFDCAQAGAVRFSQ